MWPLNLKDITLVGDLTSTELWMLKEQIDSGGAIIISGPEKVAGKRRYYTIYAIGEQAYALCTSPDIFNEKIVTKVNKISTKRVYEITAAQYG